jgi:hypothetical protein
VTAGEAFAGAVLEADWAALLPKMQPKQVALAVTSRHQALAPTPQPFTAQQNSAPADIGRHDAYPFEGLVPARGWRFKSPLRHNFGATWGERRDTLAPSNTDSGRSNRERMRFELPTEWGGHIAGYGVAPSAVRPVVMCD